MDNLPAVTKNIIIINVLMFLGTLVAEKYGIPLSHYLGLTSLMSNDFKFFQLFTYMFMHGGWAHLFFNMFAVFMFGRILEQIWGAKRFLLFYIVCGIGAGVMQEIVQLIRINSLIEQVTPETLQMIINEGGTALKQGMNYDDIFLKNLNRLINVPTVGASGSVFGILLGFGMLLPNEKLFIMPIPFPIKAKYFVIGYALIELVLGVSNNPNDNVAHFAHLGGMIFGFFLIIYWKKKGIMYWHGNKRNNDETTYFR